MTLTEAQAMSPEERRVKLAELEGWTDITHGSNYDTQYNLYGVPPNGSFKERGWKKPLPHFTTDLNAVAEVEKLVVGDFRLCLVYQENLAIACDSVGYKARAQFLWHASADQRATALILTLSEK